MNQPEQPQEPPCPEGHEDGRDDADLQQRLEEAERETGQFRKLAQRAQADLANYRKRAAEEVEEARRQTAAGLLLRIVATRDDIQRALDLVPEDGASEGWAEGLALVMRNIDSALQAEGVTRTDALGKPFEPWECEAVHYQETDEAAEGTVVSVFREGFSHQGRVLRAAQVVVAKRPETDEAAQPQNDNAEENH